MKFLIDNFGLQTVGLIQVAQYKKKHLETLLMVSEALEQRERTFFPANEISQNSEFSALPHKVLCIKGRIGHGSKRAIA